MLSEIPLLLINIGDEHYIQDEFIKAESNYDQVIKMTGINKKLIERAKLSLGKIYIKQGSFLKVSSLLTEINDQ